MPITHSPSEAAPMLTIESIYHLVLTVRDLEASALWFVRVLGMCVRITGLQTACSGPACGSVVRGSTCVPSRPPLRTGSPVPPGSRRRGPVLSHKRIAGHDHGPLPRLRRGSGRGANRKAGRPRSDRLGLCARSRWKPDRDHHLRAARSGPERPLAGEKSTSAPGATEPKLDGHTMPDRLLCARDTHY